MLSQHFSEQLSELLEQFPQVSHAPATISASVRSRSIILIAGD